MMIVCFLCSIHTIGQEVLEERDSILFMDKFGNDKGYEVVSLMQGEKNIIEWVEPLMNLGLRIVLKE